MSLISKCRPGSLNIKANEQTFYPVPLKASWVVFIFSRISWALHILFRMWLSYIHTQLARGEPYCVFACMGVECGNFLDSMHFYVMCSGSQRSLIGHVLCMHAWPGPYYTSPLVAPLTCGDDSSLVNLLPHCDEYSKTTAQVLQSHQWALYQPNCQHEILL